MGSGDVASCIMEARASLQEAGAPDELDELEEFQYGVRPGPPGQNWTKPTNCVSL